MGHNWKNHTDRLMIYDLNSSKMAEIMQALPIQSYEITEIKSYKTMIPISLH